MRIYALCTSYQPLTIYLYRAGFARFAHERYDNTDTDNLCNFWCYVSQAFNKRGYQYQCAELCEMDWWEMVFVGIKKVYVE